MRSAEVIARVEQIATNVAGGGQQEDALVELKREWPDPASAAWQIAGHANAAGGEPILWVIGLSDDGTVVPPRHEELANWWQQVRKHFDDDVAPTMKDFIVTLAAGSVVALALDTEAAPFVIKNVGKNYSVPFREGARTDGARRRHLARMLVPLMRAPRVEIVYARVATIGGPEIGQPPGHRAVATCRLYVVPQSPGASFFPRHNQRMVASWKEVHVDGIPSIAVEAAGGSGDAAISVSVPSFVDVRLEGVLPDTAEAIDEVSIEVRLHTEGTTYEAVVGRTLRKATDRKHAQIAGRVMERTAWGDPSPVQ